MNDTVEKVINIAKSQVGYLEKSKAAYKADPSVLYKFTEGAGSDNYTKYNKEMHDIYPSVMDFPAAWCDCFVDWCFNQAYGTANAKGLLGGNFQDYTPSSAQLYKNKGAYYKTPKVGDQIFFNNGTRICHTGLVYKVDANRVYTIEGNTSSGNELVANGGAVCYKSYLRTYSKIDGYGRPKYDEAVQDGWVELNDSWKYYKDGNALTSWQIIDGYKFYFNDNGIMLTGWQSIDDGWYYFEEPGYSHEGALWVSDENGCQSRYHNNFV